MKAKFLVISFSSDWLFPSYQSKEIVSACRRVGAEAIYTEIQTDYGHDAFLLESEQLTFSHHEFPDPRTKEAS